MKLLNHASTTLSKRLDTATKPGFTIVELLIVIVVIAILAAITIVAFNGIQDSAITSTAKADLRNIGTIMERYRVETGRFPNSNAEVVQALDASNAREFGASTDITKNRFIYCFGTGGSDIWIAARYAKSGSWQQGTKPIQYFSPSTGVTEGVFNHTFTDPFVWQKACRSISTQYTNRGEWSVNMTGPRQLE